MARGSGGITPIVLALVTDGHFQPLLVTLWRANAACFTSVPPERSPSRLRAVDHRRDAAGFPGKWSPARWQVPRAESDDIQRQCQQATEFELKVLASLIQGFRLQLTPHFTGEKIVDSLIWAFVKLLSKGHCSTTRSSIPSQSILACADPVVLHHRN
jgi:hypothetical protein